MTNNTIDCFNAKYETGNRILFARILELVHTVFVQMAVEKSFEFYLEHSSCEKYYK